MSKAHEGSTLPIKTCLPVDEHTTFLAHYDVTDEESLRGIVPTESIATLRPFEGKFGGGIAVEEGTTNLIKSVSNGDSFFETSTGWSLRNDGVGSSSIEESSESIYGGRVLRYQDEDGNTTTNLWDGVQLATRVTSLIPGTIYIFKVRYKVVGWTTGSVAVWSHWNDTTNVRPSISADYGLPSHTYDGKWHEHTIIQTCPTGYDAKTFRPGFNLTNLGCTLFVDAIQFEAKPFATSFVNGSRPDGYIRYPDSGHVFDGDFSFSAWTKLHTTSGWRMIIGQWTKFYFAWTSGTSNNLTISWVENGSQRMLQTTITGITCLEWNHVGFTYHKGTKTLRLYVNGVLRNTITNADLNASPQPAFSIGSISINASQHVLNGIIDEVRIDKVVRSDEEILQWYNSQSPFYPKGVHRVYS